jgi:hypothetical protein
MYMIYRILLRKSDSLMRVFQIDVGDIVRIESLILIRMIDEYDCKMRPREYKDILMIRSISV